MPAVTPWLRVSGRNLRSRPRKPARARLRLDTLEDRAVPADLSALTPLNPLGSLAYQATGTGAVSATVSDSFTLDLQAGQTLSVLISPRADTYSLTSGPLSWAAAEAEAVVAGGHLVSVNSADEQQFLLDTFINGEGATKVYWSGLNDAATVGQFVWTSGDAVTYTNWHSGEPNGGTYENYGTLNQHRALQGGGVETTGQWNDEPGSLTYLGIIEMAGGPGEFVPTVTVTGPGGEMVGTVTGTTATEPVALSNLPVAVAGTYTVTVAGDGGAGAFKARVVLNGAIEAEGAGGAANDEPAAAEELDPAFAPGGTRAAVAGILPADPVEASDWYGLTLAAGQSVTVAVTAEGAGAAYLELFDATGATPVAVGDPAPTNVGEAVTYAAPAAGRYFARVFRTVADPAVETKYSLIAVRGAFDLEPNSGPTAAQPVGRDVVAYGAVAAAGDSDFFRVTLNADDTLKVSTTTPLGPLNALDPIVRLYAADGTLVASDDNSDPDGRNARISYFSTASGTFHLAVDGAGSTIGEYSLAVDTVPTPPDLTVADVSATEGDAGTILTFTVRLSAPTTQTVTVHYATQDGTANTGSDYTGVSGDLTFQPGETEKDVVVSVMGDVDDELDESLTLILSAAVNADLADDTSIGTIADDDNTPVVSVANPAPTAEGTVGTSLVTVTVSLSEPPKKPVTVHFATQDGTALAGTDYTAIAGDLTFQPGESEKSFGVLFNGDGVVEPDETFALILSAPVNATLGTATATATITNDDQPPTANAGADRTGKEGRLIRFSAAKSFSRSKAKLTYAWDFGDGTIGTGKRPAHKYPDSGRYTAWLTVTDQAGNTATDDVVVDVLNVAPRGKVRGPALTVPGWARPFNFSATDVVAADRVQFTYRVNWGDGTTEDVIGGPTATAAHAYAQPGKYLVKLTVLDKDGGTSRVVQRRITVQPTIVEGGITFVPGTAGPDTIQILADDTGKKLTVTVNGTPAGTFATPGLGVLGLGGDDVITTTGPVARTLYLFGGDGNDLVDAGSAVGPTVLVGGAGDDTESGGAGRDVLVGGAGTDALDGRAGDDVLVGGLVAFADDPSHLKKVLAEWARTPTAYEDRRDHLLGALKGGLNLKTVLAAGTVADDGAADGLIGGDGRDWLFDSLSTPDLLTDLTADETKTRL